MNPFLRYLADKKSAHRQTDRHTPMTTRPCGLRRAGNNANTHSITSISHISHARNPQRISSTDSTFSTDSLDLVSVMVWTTQEMSRSDFAHLPFQTHNPTQPTKTNFRPIPDQPNPTRGSTQPTDNSEARHCLVT